MMSMTIRHNEALVPSHSSLLCVNINHSLLAKRKAGTMKKNGSLPVIIYLMLAKFHLAWYGDCGNASLRWSSSYSGENSSLTLRLLWIVSKEVFPQRVEYWTGN